MEQVKIDVLIFRGWSAMFSEPSITSGTWAPRFGLYCRVNGAVKSDTDYWCKYAFALINIHAAHSVGLSPSCVFHEKLATVVPIFIVCRMCLITSHIPTNELKQWKPNSALEICHNHVCLIIPLLYVHKHHAQTRVNETKHFKQYVS